MRNFSFKSSCYLRSFNALKHSFNFKKGYRVEDTEQRQCQVPAQSWRALLVTPQNLVNSNSLYNSIVFKLPKTNSRIHFYCSRYSAALGRRCSNQ